tara:strand:+ start:976 stop:1353 length:378 start_codon:yes stop_codon:yes gene_type:complete
MAHFCKIGTGNIVEKIEVVSNDIATNEEAGVNFLNNLYKTSDVWKQTSYNTLAGVHKLDGTPFRKNYGCIGYTYDESKDAFIAPKSFNSWTLNETTCVWEAPVVKPDDGKKYSWNESTVGWDLIE